MRYAKATSAVGTAAWAVIETYEFSSPELEQRYQDLSAELRCPKCQNQNIADSNAPIAKDLRKLLYQQLEEGASDEEIRDHMVARYGEFVRYRPSFSGATVILWLAPALLLLAAAMYQQNLGANPIETLNHTTGSWTLRFLLLTLALRPTGLFGR